MAKNKGFKTFLSPNELEAIDRTRAKLSVGRFASKDPQAQSIPKLNGLNPSHVIIDEMPAFDAIAAQTPPEHFLFDCNGNVRDSQGRRLKKGDD